MASAAAIFSELERGRVAPLYYFCGDERFLVERAIVAVRRLVLEDASRELNFDLIVAREAGAAGIVAAARTLPMLGKRRLVLVREADTLPPKELDALLPYVRDPNPSTCLVLVGAKADARQSFFSDLAARGLLVRFDALRPREVPAWLRDEAKALGLAIEGEALALLQESVGTDLGCLAQSLERLSLYVGDERRIRAKDVEEVILGARSRSVFELCEAVGRGNRREALVVLASMADDRERPTAIVAMLARHVRQLWGVRELGRAGEKDAEMAQKLGIRPYFVPPLREQARRFSERALGRAHAALVETDRALKSSRVDEWLLIERCVQRLVDYGETATRGDLRPR